MTDETAQVAAQEPSATPTPPEPHPNDARPTVADAFRQVEESSDEQVVEPAEPVTEPVTEPEGDRPRNADGTFKAKEPTEGEDAPQEAEKPPVEAKEVEKAPETPEEDTGITEAPQRFHETARQEWSKAPASVRGEMTRVMKENERGIQELQDRWEPLKEYAELAKQNGTDIQTALKQYIAFEQNIRRDPIAGLTQTCKELGLDFNQIIAEVSGKEGVPQTSTAMTALQSRFDAMEGQLSQVSTTIQTQQNDANLRDVQAFAADNPRFEELSPVISDLLKTGFATELSDAYDKAERLNPAPVTDSAPAAQTGTPTPPIQADQTRVASLSVSGAPASGNEPEKRKVPGNARDAVAGAFAQLG